MRIPPTEGGHVRRSASNVEPPKDFVLKLENPKEEFLLLLLRLIWRHAVDLLPGGNVLTPLRATICGDVIRAKFISACKRRDAGKPRIAELLSFYINLAVQIAPEARLRQISDTTDTTESEVVVNENFDETSFAIAVVVFLGSETEGDDVL